MSRCTVPAMTRALLAKAVRVRGVESVSHDTCVPGGQSFYAYDEEGGILLVTVTQYKDPIG